LIEYSLAATFDSPRRRRRPEAGIIVPIRLQASALARQFQLGNALFQLRDLFTRPFEDGALGIEFFAGDKVEAAQSMRQHIPKIGFHVVPRLRQSRRNQGSQPVRELVYGVHVDHVVASMRTQIRTS
jgi:hypothetical protein